MKKQFQVPFDKDGNHRTQDYYWDKKQKLIENYEFEDTFQYIGYEGAASTSIIVWKNSEGKEFRSSMLLLDEILRCKPERISAFLGNTLSIWGKFTFAKRGSAIFLTFAE